MQSIRERLQPVREENKSDKLRIAHLRGMWPATKNNENYEPGMGQRGRMSAYAAVLALEAGLVNKVVITGGAVTGNEPIRELMAKELKRYDIPDDKIVTTGSKNIRESGGETQAWLEYLAQHPELNGAKKYEIGWQYHLDGIFKFWYPRFKETPKDIEPLAVETLIEKYAANLNKKVFRGFQKWFGVQYFIWEKILKQAVYLIKGPEWARARAESSRNKVGQNAPIPIEIEE